MTYADYYCFGCRTASTDHGGNTGDNTKRCRNCGKELVIKLKQ
jgi:DNA-directed RNA polymerase subunit RPC12/RpoP